jgi:hypothetical protein
MGFGMVLYLFKLSCPNISNSVTVFSKKADGAAEVSFQGNIGYN